MIVTEEEAARYWCPFVRQSGVFEDKDSDGNRYRTGFAYNRSALESTYPCRCIASSCMAWRWTVRRDLDVNPTVDDRGYCGLAGKP